MVSPKVRNFSLYVLFFFYAFQLSCALVLNTPPFLSLDSATTLTWTSTPADPPTFDLGFECGQLGSASIGQPNTAAGRFSLLPNSVPGLVKTAQQQKCIITARSTIDGSLLSATGTLTIPAHSSISNSVGTSSLGSPTSTASPTNSLFTQSFQKAIISEPVHSDPASPGPTTIGGDPPPITKPPSSATMLGLHSSTNIVESNAIQTQATATTPTQVTDASATLSASGVDATNSGNSIAKSSKSNRTAIIVGSVLGALALMISMAFAFVCRRRRRRKAMLRPESNGLRSGYAFVMAGEARHKGEANDHQPGNLDIRGHSSAQQHVQPTSHSQANTLETGLTERPSDIVATTSTKEAEVRYERDRAEPEHRGSETWSFDFDQPPPEYSAVPDNYNRA